MKNSKKYLFTTLYALLIIGCQNPFNSTQNGIYDPGNCTLRNKVELTSGAIASPDGKKIVFVQENDYIGKVYTMNIDGTDLKRITGSSAEITESNPVWSPDSKQITFISGKKDYGINSNVINEINIINSDGSGLKSLDKNKFHLRVNWSPDSKKLIFVASDKSPVVIYEAHTENEIYMINIDGSSLQRITNNDINDNNPVFSPDGSKIVYESGSDKTKEIWLKDLKSSNLSRLTNNSFIDFQPIWSSNSEFIYFISGLDNIFNIFRVNKNGGEPEKITDFKTKQEAVNNSGFTEEYTNFSPQSLSGGYIVSPVLSPDQKSLVFSKKDKSNLEIYTIDTDGKNLKLLSVSSGDKLKPVWSSDSSKIIFIKQESLNYKYIEPEIFIVNKNGNNLKKLTRINNNNFNPVWSPDNKKIIFVSNRNGNHDLFVINTDGTGLKALTGNNFNNGQPSWSPDGSKITFVSNKDGNDEVYTVNADGSGLKRITENNQTDKEPVWSTDGSKIVFVSNQNNNEEVFSVKSDGSELFKLTDMKGNKSNIRWSSDGKMLLFLSEDGLSRGINIVNSDGTNQKQLTNNSFKFSNLVWSTDNKKIIFSSDKTGHDNLYQINIENKRISDPGIKVDYTIFPVISPDYKKIAYTELDDKNKKNTLTLADLNNPEKKSVIENKCYMNGTVWSNDSKKLAFLSNESGHDNIYIIGLEDKSSFKLTH